MIKLLEGASNKSIAFEIIGNYEVSDEKAIEKLFDEKLSEGINKIGFLIKIDGMSFSKASWKALWNDGIYGLKHLKNCSHIAIVGNSKFEEFLVKIDNTFFENKRADRIEKYFDVAKLDIALGWVNE